jgi:hypothetical protein
MYYTKKKVEIDKDKNNEKGSKFPMEYYGQTKDVTTLNKR